MKLEQPPFFCTLRFFKKLGYGNVVWIWLSTSVFRNQIFYCILNTSFYFPLRQSVLGLGYRLDDRGFGDWPSSRSRVCSLLQNLKYGPGVHTASCLIGTGLKRVWGWGTVRWPLPSSTEIKNEWLYTSILPHTFLMWCLVKHHNFIFTVIKVCLDVRFLQRSLPTFFQYDWPVKIVNFTSKLILGD